MRMSDVHHQEEVCETYEIMEDIRGKICQSVVIEKGKGTSDTNGTV